MKHSFFLSYYVLLVQMQVLGSHTRLLVVLYTMLPRVIDCG